MELRRGPLHRRGRWSPVMGCVVGDRAEGLGPREGGAVRGPGNWPWDRAWGQRWAGPARGDRTGRTPHPGPGATRPWHRQDRQGCEGVTPGLARGPVHELPPRASQAAAPRCHVTRAERDGGRARTPRPESPPQQREQRGPVFWLPHASPSASHRAAHSEVSQRQPGPREASPRPEGGPGPGPRPAPSSQASVPRPPSVSPPTLLPAPPELPPGTPSSEQTAAAAHSQTLEGKLRQRAGVSAQHLRRGPVRTAGFGVLVLWGTPMAVLSRPHWRPGPRWQVIPCPPGT